MPLLICPNCNVGMAQVQRSGIEIDVCPQCRGVWLDRGELEKLLQPLREESAEASASFIPSSGPSGTPSAVWSAPASHHMPHPQHYPDHHGDHGHGYPRQKGWRSLLDVFD